MIFTPRVRRTLAALSLGAIALTSAGCGSGDADASTKAGDEASTVRLTVFPSLNSVGAHTAQSQGVFKAEGLDVQLTAGSNAATAIPQMIGGSVDVVLMDMVTPIIAREKGLPLVMIAPAGVTKEPKENRGFINVIVKANSPLRTLADLQSASVGVVQINSQPWMDTRAAVDAAGADSSKVGFVEVPNLTAALDQGQVDAIVVPDPVGVTALANPANRLLGAVATKEQVGQPEYAFVTTEKFASSNPGTIAKFQAAILRANEQVNASDEKALEVAKTYLEVPPEILARSTIPAMATSPLTGAVIEKSTSRMAKYGLITTEQAAQISSKILYSSK